MYLFFTDPLGRAALYTLKKRKSKYNFSIRLSMKGHRFIYMISLTPWAELATSWLMVPCILYIKEEIDTTTVITRHWQWQTCTNFSVAPRRVSWSLVIVTLPQIKIVVMTFLISIHTHTKPCGIHNWNVDNYQHQRLWKHSGIWRKEPHDKYT